MTDVVGIDSRPFTRKTIKEGRECLFESVLGVAIRVRDYNSFDRNYKAAIEATFKEFNIPKEYSYYCYNDIKDNPYKWDIISKIIERIKGDVDKVHVFYTLFSKQRLPQVKVYGRLSKIKKIKLSNPTRSYKELISSHLVNCFPGICAWRLMYFFYPGKTQFHLDSYEGHICEAEEELEKSKFQRIIYPSGDCMNATISIADLLTALIDKRLEEKNLCLIFENIRPVLSEFGDKVLVYPISNKHLSKITPIDTKTLDNLSVLKRPVYWVFKGAEEIDLGELKRSKAYRNLIDCIANKGGSVKVFNKRRDARFMKKGDYGVYLNSIAEETVKTYNKIGKKLNLLNFDLFIKSEDRNI
jgi:hypothetical protein